MTKGIAIANQKGGVGKTSTTVNPGAGLVRKGYDVLLIDLDSQANLTMALGFQNPDDMDFTISNVLHKAVKERNIGHLYLNGYGVKKNYQKAIEWLSKAVAQNNKWAQFDLGACYENGYGVARNMQTALVLYKKAAAQGHINAKKRIEALKR